MKNKDNIILYYQVVKLWIRQVFKNLHDYIMTWIKRYTEKNKNNQLDVFDRLVYKIKNDSIKLPFAEVNDSLKYIVDIETNRIVWLDEGLEKKVGDDKIGKLCYEILQGCTHPCDFCSNHKLIKEGEVIQWIHYNEKHEKTYLVRDFLKIIDGRKLRYEMAIDVTRHLKQNNNG